MNSKVARATFQVVPWERGFPGNEVVRVSCQTTSRLFLTADSFHGFGLIFSTYPREGGDQGGRALSSPTHTTTNNNNSTRQKKSLNISETLKVLVGLLDRIVSSFNISNSGN